MILTGDEISKGVKDGKITIVPFDKKYLNPNSYNFHIDEEIFTFPDKEILDVKKPPKTKKLIFTKDGLLLEPNRLYLGCTVENMGSNFYVPFIEGRSSIGRLGLFVHITAPLGDIGYLGKWTLQLKSTIPVIIYPKQAIGQIMFIVPKGNIDLYSGKYQGGKGPQWSGIYKDYECL